MRPARAGQDRRPADVAVLVLMIFSLSPEGRVVSKPLKRRIANGLQTATRTRSAGTANWRTGTSQDFAVNSKARREQEFDLRIEEIVLV